MIFSKISGKISEIRKDYGIYKLNNLSGSRIIMYHGIDLIENRKFNSRHLGVKNLERQLLFFKKHFNILSVKDYFNKSNHNPNQFNIAITFDDGLKNNFSNALPLFEEMKIPATFYVTQMNESEHKILWPDLYDIFRSMTNEAFIYNQMCFKKNLKNGHFYNDENIAFYDIIKDDPRNMSQKINELMSQAIEKIGDFQKDPQFDPYWKLMTDNEIKKTSTSQYVSIGSHAQYHNSLGRIPHENAVKELINSKNYLETLTQTEITSIAYPDGSYTRQLVESSKKFGYSELLAVDYLFDCDIKDDSIQNRMGLYALAKPEKPSRIGYNIIHKK